MSIVLTLLTPTSENYVNHPGGADSAPPPAISHVSGSVVLIFVGIVAFIEFNCSEPPKW